MQKGFERKFFKAVALVALPCLLAACSSNESEQYAKSQALEGKISLLQPNQELLERLMGDYELVQTVASQISSSSIYDESLQPKNKKEQCLLPFMVGAANTKMYWDGMCKDGYAVGLGRAIRIENNDRKHEFLFEIDEGYHDLLHTYLHIDHYTGEVELGNSLIALDQDRLRGYAATLEYNRKAWKNGEYDLSYRYEDTSNLLSYTKVIDLINGGVSSIVAYPNFSHDLYSGKDNILSSIERSYRIVEGSNTVGLSFIWDKDGRLLMRDNETNTDSVVTVDSTELENYINDLSAKVEEQIAPVEQNVDMGLAKLEQYVKDKCSKPKALYRGDKSNQICSFSADFIKDHESLVKAKEDNAHKIENYQRSQDSRLMQLESKFKLIGIK